MKTYIIQFPKKFLGLLKNVVEAKERVERKTFMRRSKNLVAPAKYISLVLI